MTDELQPSTIRSRGFSTVRRGYDRDEVDGFKASVADRVAELEAQLASMEGRLEQLGIADPGELRTELETVADEVGKIIAAAREAAGGLRSRAAEDAARWRAEADREARELRSRAQRDAEGARGSAWEAASALLDETKAAAESMLHGADQDALFIRAQAEREALRLTGDARRDAEEELRAARTEAERLLIDARAESEATLTAARQSAEAAQERARALEARRSELMEELETARLSIGQIEEQKEAQRDAAASPADSPVAPAGEPLRDGSEWLDVDASVRIVPAGLLPSADEPVDADALAEEVAALRAAAEAEPIAPLEVVEIEEAALGAAAPMDVVEAEPESVAASEEESGDGAERELPVTTDGSVIMVEPQESAEPEPEPIEPEPIEPEPIEPEPIEPEAEDVGDDSEDEPSTVATAPSSIDGLFAKLREPEIVAEPPPEAEPEPSTPELLPAVEEAVIAEPPKEASAGSEPTHAAATDPFELRDRLLLPIQNRTLRTLKRRIVDLQNRVLEELRVSGPDWTVDRAMFAAAVGEDVVRLSQESFVAGYAGAAELVGAAATPPPDRGAALDASADFIDGIKLAVDEALERTRAADGGSRQISAAVSRVFRAWRTDEAERRLRQAGYRAYHEGLLGALPELGVIEVMCLAPGRPCGVCPARSGITWTPGDPPPAPLPPAAPSCDATVVPVA
jgi:DivIVA domain-containing protein